MSTHSEDRLDRFKDLTRKITLNPDSIDMAILSHTIMRIPIERQKAAQEVASAFIDKKNIDRDLKKIRAQKMLYASANKTQKGLSNADDRRAFVDNDEEVEEVEAAAILIEADYLSAKMYYDVVDDLFTACRKVMSYKSEQEKAQREYDRYVNEGIRNS